MKNNILKPINWTGQKLLMIPELANSDAKCPRQKNLTS